RTVGAIAVEGATAEGPVSIDRAAPVAAEERAAALVGDRQGARDARGARSRRRRLHAAARRDGALEQRPLVRPQVRLAPGAAEVAAVGRSLAAPAGECGVGLGV